MNNDRNDDSPPPGGFVLEQLLVPSEKIVGRRRTLDPIRMWLPRGTTKDPAFIARQKRLIEVDDAAIAADRADSLAELEVAKKGFAKPPSAKATGTLRLTGAIDVAAERAYLKKLASSQTRRRRRNTGKSQAQEHDQVQAYSWDQPLKLIEDDLSKTSDRDVVARLRVLFNRLKVLGHFRLLARNARMRKTSPSLEAALDGLEQAQPHFGDVVELVRNQVALARLRGDILSIPPLLLLGEPGLGKTHFSQSLAQVLGVPIHRHAFDSSTTASALTGTHRHWANTKTGIVFDLVALGSAADPVLLLDEIDKAMVGGNCDPLAPLHSLLEPITACRVVDVSVELEVDASHITWIATANDPGRIPPSIRSRFTEFLIEPPTGAGALQMAHAITTRLHRQLHQDAPAQHTKAVAKLIAHLTPREQLQALNRAYAKAAVNGRCSLEISDLPVELWMDSETVKTGKSSHLH